jgi:hypothetical protein
MTSDLAANVFLLSAFLLPATIIFSSWLHAHTLYRKRCHGSRCEAHRSRYCLDFLCVAHCQLHHRGKCSPHHEEK